MEKIEKLKTEISNIYGERLSFDHWEELEYSVIDEIGLKVNEIIDRLNEQPEEQVCMKCKKVIPTGETNSSIDGSFICCDECLWKDTTEEMVFTKPTRGVFQETVLRGGKIVSERFYEDDLPEDDEYMEKKEKKILQMSRRFGYTNRALALVLKELKSKLKQ
jgi:hypothetical protein